MCDRGHNRHGPKRRRGCCAPFEGSWDPVWPSYTMWRGPRSTSVPSGIFIHPAVCHNRHGPKMGGGGCALFSGSSWVSIEHKVALAEAYLHTKWNQSIQSFGHNGYWPKIGGCTPLGEGELGPHLTQCRIVRCLKPYQVAS